MQLSENQEVYSLNRDFFANSTVNSTLPTLDENEIHKRVLKKASNVLTIMCLCSIMLAMGADISWKQIWNHLRRPVAVGIGMASQFIVMPLVGFSFINAMSLSHAHAISVLLMACCPGGAVSNVFAYYLDGDVPLSVTMTTLSTLFALGLMPFNLWLYGKWIDTGDLVIPYQSMAISLAYVTSPACLGIIIRWKSSSAAYWITKVCSILGFIFIAISITLQNVAYPEIFAEIPATLYIASVAMPSVGFALGFCFAWMLRRPIAVRKTVSIESGIQNVGVAMGVISVSPFEFEIQKSLLGFPTMYALSMITLCFLLCTSYQLLFKKMCKKAMNVKVKEITFGDSIEIEKSVPASPVAYELRSCDFHSQRTQ